MSYSIHPDAEAELGDAAVYYATHGSGMIALAFLAEYERVRDLLIENQQRGPVVKMAFASITSIAFPTPWCTKKMTSTALKSSLSRIKVANPDTGMTESELLKLVCAGCTPSPPGRGRGLSAAAPDAPERIWTA